MSEKATKAPVSPLSEIIRYYCREDEMLTFHKGGQYWTTLYADGPEKALQIGNWLENLQKVNAKRVLDEIDRYCPECGHSRGTDYETDGCAHCIKQERDALSAALKHGVDLMMIQPPPKLGEFNWRILLEIAQKALGSNKEDVKA